MNKYSKITEHDVINQIIKCAYDWNGPGIISPSNIARNLNTSRYQVNKNIKILIEKNHIEYKSVSVGDSDNSLPYNGYCLSEHGKKLSSKELSDFSKKERKLIKKCFGI